MHCCGWLDSRSLFVSVSVSLFAAASASAPAPAISVAPCLMKQSDARYGTGTLVQANFHSGIRMQELQINVMNSKRRHQRQSASAWGWRRFLRGGEGRQGNREYFDGSSGGSNL